MTVWRGNWRLNFWWFAYSTHKHVRRVRKVCIFTNVFAMNFVKVKTNYWHWVHIHERANTWEETVKGEEGGWVGGLDANTEWRRNASQTNNNPSHQGAPLLAYNINVVFIACIDNMVGDTNVSCKTVCLKPDEQLSKIYLSLIPQLLSSHSDFNGQI